MLKYRQKFWKLLHLSSLEKHSKQYKYLSIAAVTYRSGFCFYIFTGIKELNNWEPWNNAPSLYKTSAMSSNRYILCYSVHNKTSYAQKYISYNNTLISAVSRHDFVALKSHVLRHLYNPHLRSMQILPERKYRSTDTISHILLRWVHSMHTRPAISISCYRSSCLI